MTHCSGVSIANFEQVNTDWLISPIPIKVQKTLFNFHDVEKSRYDIENAMKSGTWQFRYWQIILIILITLFHIDTLLRKMHEIQVLYIGHLVILWSKYFYKTLLKKWSFPLSISSVNVTKTVSCGFSHIYKRDP